MKKDYISVVIPMYNAQDTIEKALKSLTNQTYDNIEVIVVNDGSKDNSKEVVEEYMKIDNRVRLISIENAGVSNARNLAIKNSTGEYITFLDADDYLEKDTLEKMLLKLKEENVELVRTTFIQEDINGEFIQRGNLYDVANRKLGKNEIRNEFIPYVFEGKMPTYVGLLLVKAECIKDKLTFDTSLHMMEDLIFCMQLYLSIDSMYVYDFATYHYVYSQNSNSNARSKLQRNYNNILHIVDKLNSVFANEQLEEFVYKKMYHIYAKICINLIINMIEEDDEFTPSYEEYIKIVTDNKFLKLISNVDYAQDKEIVRVGAKYLLNKEYDELYNYAKSKNK